jgi:hypothetical protein
MKLLCTLLFLLSSTTPIKPPNTTQLAVQGNNIVHVTKAEAKKLLKTGLYVEGCSKCSCNMLTPKTMSEADRLKFCLTYETKECKKMCKKSSKDISDLKVGSEIPMDSSISFGPPPTAAAPNFNPADLKVGDEIPLEGVQFGGTWDKPPAPADRVGGPVPDGATYGGTYDHPPSPEPVTPSTAATKPNPLTYSQYLETHPTTWLAGLIVLAMGNLIYKIRSGGS